MIDLLQVELRSLNRWKGLLESLSELYTTDFSYFIFLNKTSV